MKTVRVVHNRKQKFDVYIGRPSKWGNQFEIGQDGNRTECIEKYREWFHSPEQKQLRVEAIKELTDKTLGCWCYPKACHGQVLVEFVDSVKVSRQTGVIGVQEAIR